MCESFIILDINNRWYYRADYKKSIYKIKAVVFKFKSKPVTLVLFRLSFIFLSFQRQGNVQI